jgi:pimeloyl-ACP methyl ester carboxylesterase
MPFVSNGPVQIHYEVAGTGPPLMLIHGWTSSGADWDRLGYVPAFAEHFTTITMDLRGHGQTSAAAEFNDLVVNTLAADVGMVLDALDLSQAAIFGYSMGGMTALVYALEHPERISALVAGAANIDSDRAYYTRMWAQRPPLYRRIIPGLRRRFLRLVSAVRRPADRGPDWMQLAQASGLSREQSWDQYLTNHEELRSRASLITAPTLLVQGSRDPLFDIEAGRAFAEGLSNGTFVEVPGIGHELQDRSDVLLPIVMEFLTDALLERSPGEGG